MIKTRIFSIIWIVLSFFLLAGNAIAESPQVPAPVGDIYVQDFANVLSEQEELEIRQFGRSIENQTTAQIAVLTVDSIGETTIEEYANEAFRQYGIGSESEDNGVLLVIGFNPSPGMTERPLRIEVGYGLEGRLPDGKVGRILDQITIPYLKMNQPNTAIIETYKVLANEVFAEYGIEGGQQPIEQPYTQAEPTDEGIGIPLWLLIPIIAVVIFLDFKFFGGFLTHILLSILSRGRGGGGGGGYTGGGGGSSGGGGASRGW
ncbi:TPM domain-containing protein [Mesobacillus maritimus]|uniref:TPM domain-containing protein n=1 Tax=Mesobacillus maritimus TaxID=1643336 RepID=UPI00203DA790|nr:TPM domain-containing protein [Mesobacillus maritimus]MCM3585374.1 TPM domain-containing protein [Mesobacillus maritimus]